MGFPSVPPIRTLRHSSSRMNWDGWCVVSVRYALGTHSGRDEGREGRGVRGGRGQWEG